MFTSTKQSLRPTSMTTLTNAVTATTVRAGWDIDALEFFASMRDGDVQVAGAWAGVTENMLSEYSDAHKSCYGCRSMPYPDVTPAELVKSISALYESAEAQYLAEQAYQAEKDARVWEFDESEADVMQFMFDTMDCLTAIARR